MKKLRVGLCGLGFMGWTHLAAYAAIREVELAAICHASAKRFKGKAEGNIKQSGGGEAILKKARRYDTPAEMLSSEDLDFVDVCTPTFTHPGLACQALNAGLHVLCEKPMALSVRECDRMICAARSTRRFLMVAHCLRWWPEYVYLHQLTHSKRYGALKSLYLFRGSMPTSWATWMTDERKSGGPLLDLHIHDLDQVLWLLGAPAAVAASLSRDRRAGSVSYRYRDCVVTAEYNANLRGGFVFNMTYRAEFERATLVYDLSQKQPLILWANGKQTFPKLSSANAYAGEIRYFVDCVRRDRAPTQLTPKEARNGVALALLERESARRGQWVKVKF